ncbi:MAG: hypothetical protein J5J00_02875 [Deltaproteobacteria bacterium]|nr:hypothetical protein [Deltaproteobacteria bacterium]
MEVNQHYSMLFFNCAMAKKSAGDKDRALADIDQAIAISPNGGAFKSVRKDFE